MIDFLGIQFPVIYIHLGTLLLTAVSILIADKFALAWVSGKKQMLSQKRMRILHLLVGAGLTVMIASGAYMAWPLREYLLGEPAFWTKMLFVTVLVVNSFFIGRAAKLSTTRPFAELTKGEKSTLLISGGVSTIGWLGAFTAALYMTTSNWILSFLTALF